jgi:hypothetical protein
MPDSNRPNMEAKMAQKFTAWTVEALFALQQRTKWKVYDILHNKHTEDALSALRQILKMEQDHGRTGTFIQFAIDSVLKTKIHRHNCKCCGRS